MTRILFYTGKIRAMSEATICDECDLPIFWREHGFPDDTPPLPEDVEDGKPMTNGASFYTEDGA